MEPAAQATQADCPVVVTYFPTPHTVQVVDAVSEEKVPMAQLVHAPIAPVPYFPAAQGRHLEMEEWSAKVAPVR